MFNRLVQENWYKRNALLTIYLQSHATVY